jgi:hypothetical protein
VATAATIAEVTRQTLVATPALMYHISAGSAWSLHALGSAGLSTLGGALFARAVSAPTPALAEEQCARVVSAPTPAQAVEQRRAEAAEVMTRVEGELLKEIEVMVDTAGQPTVSVPATQPPPTVSDAAAVAVQMDPPISSYPAVAQLGGLVVVPEAGVEELLNPGVEGHMRTWRVYWVSAVHVGGWFVGTTDASVNERQAAMLGKLCRHVEHCAGATADTAIDAAMHASGLDEPISAVLGPHGLAGHVTALLQSGCAPIVIGNMARHSACVARPFDPILRGVLSARSTGRGSVGSLIRHSHRPPPSAPCPRCCSTYPMAEMHREVRHCQVQDPRGPALPERGRAYSGSERRGPAAIAARSAHCASPVRPEAEAGNGAEARGGGDNPAAREGLSWTGPAFPDR